MHPEVKITKARSPDTIPIYFFAFKPPACIRVIFLLEVVTKSAYALSI